MARNPSIEALRFALMFGIVLEHVMAYSGNRAVASVLDSCVDGFVFISGYYGIKFKISKVLRLMLLAVGYSIALNLIDLLSGNNIGNTLVGLLKIRGWWFLWAYLVVMLLVPLMEYGNPDKRKFGSAAVPVIALVFVWSYAIKLPFFRDVLPSPVGFGPLTFLTLFGVYVFARMFRLCALDRKINPSVYVVGGFMAVLLAARGEWWHNSLPMLFLAMTWFVVFSRLRLPDILGRILAWCGPSMLPVYILHCNDTTSVLWKDFSDYLTSNCGVPSFLSSFVIAVVVFLLCLFVDALRRVIASPMLSLLKRWLDVLDQKYDQLMHSLERWCCNG